MLVNTLFSFVLSGIEFIFFSEFRYLLLLFHWFGFLSPMHTIRSRTEESISTTRNLMFQSRFSFNIFPNAKHFFFTFSCLISYRALYISGTGNISEPKKRRKKIECVVKIICRKHNLFSTIKSTCDALECHYIVRNRSNEQSTNEMKIE